VTVSSSSAPADDAGDGLAGLRILLVEDEMMLSMLLEDWLLEAGCDVVGPAASLGRARLLAGMEEIDAAILDVNLGGETVYEVAEILTARGLPFVFTTGYSVTDMDGRFRESPAVQKPFRHAELLAALRAARASAPD
jgi:DNA-binding response OmpR family regulator